MPAVPELSGGDRVCWWIDKILVCDYGLLEDLNVQDVVHRGVEGGKGGVLL